MRLRQVVIAVPDLRPVEEAVFDLLGLEVAYRDPHLGPWFGLRHGLYPVGDRFLEVVSPARGGTAVGRFLDARGPGGYMVLLQTTGLDAHRQRVESAGIRVVHEADGGEGIRSIHLHPADVGGAILSFDEADPPESWGWAGPDWRYHVRSDVVTDLVGVELTAPDPAGLAERWGTAVDVPAVDGRIALADADIRFTSGDGTRIAAFDMVAADRSRVGESFTIGGVDIRLT